MKVFAVFVVMAIVAYASAEETTAAVAADEFTKMESPKIMMTQAMMSPTGPMNLDIPFGLDVCMVPAKYGHVLCLAKCLSESAMGGFCEGIKCWCVYKGTKPGKSM